MQQPQPLVIGLGQLTQSKNVGTDAVLELREHRFAIVPPARTDPTPALTPNLWTWIARNYGADTAQDTGAELTRMADGRAELVALSAVAGRAPRASKRR